MCSLITVEAFAEKHDVSMSSIYVKKSDFNLEVAFPKNKLKERKILINETFFVRRKDFRNRVQLESQDMFFELNETMRISDVMTKKLALRIGLCF